MIPPSYTAHEKETHGIPHEFICPLTLEIMVNPLMDRSGRSYERNAILEWITTKNSTCPITRQPLFVKDLLPNNKLRKEIMKWREDNGDDAHNLSPDDAIQLEEIIRALQVWGRSNFDFKYVTSYHRRRNSRRHSHHRHHPHHIDNTRPSAIRFMRIFNRQQI